MALSKHKLVRDGLQQSIMSGEFAAGEQMPGEHVIAKRFGVSYMTARRAVCDLVEADLLERRSGKGTYVRLRTDMSPTVATLNLITTAYDGSMVRDFIRNGFHLADSRGWRANIVRLGPGQQDLAVKAVREGDYSIVMLDDIPTTSALAEAMRGQSDRTVVVQFRKAYQGVPAVMYDESATIDLAVRHLREAGHQRIALVPQAPPIESGIRQRSRWRELMSERFSEADIDAMLIEIDVPLFRCPSQQAYEAIRSYLSRETVPVTAMITLGDEIAIGVMQACRDAGRSVPESISLVNVGDSPLLAMANPAVTAVDVNYHDQLAASMKILVGKLMVSPFGEPYVVAPKLRLGESVRNVG
ncbi:MAG TPA: LacI family DNA-binding transcriptional regulator [Capsulimonadaceae bacterium]